MLLIPIFDKSIFTILRVLFVGQLFSLYATLVLFFSVQLRGSYNPVVLMIQFDFIQLYNSKLLHNLTTTSQYLSAAILFSKNICLILSVLSFTELKHWCALKYCVAYIWDYYYTKTSYPLFNTLQIFKFQMF